MMEKKQEAYYVNFGRRLKELRRVSGITQDDLAAACGLSPVTISVYDHGLRLPDPSIAARMAKALHISVEDLFGTRKPRVAIANGQGIERMRRIHGRKGVERLREVYSGTGNQTEDDLSEDLQVEYSLEMQKMALLAQQRLTERYTSKRHQRTVEVKAKATAEAVKEINDAIADMICAAVTIKREGKII